MYSQIKVFFDSSEAALLSVGLLDEYSSVEDLKLKSEKDSELLPQANIAVELELQLQARIDDFKYLGHSSDISFTLDGYSDEGYFQREDLRKFLLSANRPDLVKNIDKVQNLDFEETMSPRRESTLLKVIGGLAYKLAETDPENLMKNGSPFKGYSKETGDAGLVGLLCKSGLTGLQTSALEDIIGNSLKRIKK
jgi:hypothetical protein